MCWISGLKEIFRTLSKWYPRCSTNYKKNAHFQAGTRCLVYYLSQKISGRTNNYLIVTPEQPVPDILVAAICRANPSTHSPRGDMLPNWNKPKVSCAQAALYVLRVWEQTLSSSTSLVPLLPPRQYLIFMDSIQNAWMIWENHFPQNKIIMSYLDVFS